MPTSPPASPLGARTPRLCSVPTYRESLGQEAIELGATAGLILDPWQCDLMTHALGVANGGQWTAAEVAEIVARQNGKGSTFEVRELAGLVLFGERLIVHTAHELKTSLEAFRRVQALFTNYDELRKLVKKVVNANGDEGIELLSGQRLRFIARSKGSGRGFTADCLIWDEAYALTEDQVDAQMPALSAVPNAQIWYGSSPPLNCVDGAVLMRVRRRGLGGDPTLAYFDWGVEGCLDDLSEIDLDDRSLWAASNPAYVIRITEATIERERRAMSDEGFARERLGIWPPDLTQGFRVISEADWTAACEEQSQIYGIRAFAIAASWDRQIWSIGAAGRRRDGLMHGELVDARSSPGGVVERAVRLKEKWKPCAFVVDPVSPAGSLIPDLEAAGIEVTKVGTTDAARAFGMFYDGVAGQPYLDDETGKTVDPRDFRHIGQSELTSAVASGVKRPVGDGFAWDLKAGTSPHIVAVTNAVYGFRSFVPEPEQPFFAARR